MFAVARSTLCVKISCEGSVMSLRFFFKIFPNPNQSLISGMSLKNGI